MMTKKDLHRFNRYVMNFILPNLPVPANDINMPRLDIILNLIRKHGNRSSVCGSEDWETRQMPANCLPVLRKINVSNNLITTTYFAREIINKSIDNSIHTRNQIFFMILFDAVARIKETRDQFDLAANDHAYLAAELTEKIKIYPKNSKNAELAEMLKFSNRKSFQISKDAFLKEKLNFLVTKGMNPAFVLHIALLRARVFGLRFMPGLQKKYIEKMKEIEGFDIAK